MLRTKGFWIDCFFSTLWIFGIAWVFFSASSLGIFKVFQPIGDAYADLEISDIANSYIRKDPPIDDAIILVNSSTLSNRELAAQLSIINQYNPKAVGLGIVLEEDPEDMMGNFLLLDVLNNTPNLILATKWSKTDSLMEETPGEPIFDQKHVPHSLFQAEKSIGHINFENDTKPHGEFKITRRFHPVLMEDTAFAVKVAMKAYPEKAARIWERSKETEVINYRGNVLDVWGRTNYPTSYFVLDWHQALNEEFTPEAMENKVIMIGYLGEDLRATDWENRLYTPLNKQYSGKGNPDMYPIAIQANIFSMINQEAYVNEMSTFWVYAWAIIGCFILIIPFSIIYRTLPRMYDGITKVLQLIILALLFTSVIYVYDWFDFKLNFTYTMVVVVISGDSLEAYYGLARNLFIRERRQQLVTLFNKIV